VRLQQQQQQQLLLLLLLLLQLHWSSILIIWFYRYVLHSGTAVFLYLYHTQIYTCIRNTLDCDQSNVLQRALSIDIKNPDQNKTRNGLDDWLLRYGRTEFSKMAVGWHLRFGPTESGATNKLLIACRYKWSLVTAVKWSLTGQIIGGILNVMNR